MKRKLTSLLKGFTLIIGILIIIGVAIWFWPAKDYGNYTVIQAEDNINYEFFEVNDVTLHVALSGPDDGEPVFLLHGYPDASFGWREQIIALSNEGYRVIAPDQRGYNLSSKPKGKENYAQEILIKDIIALADYFNYDTFNLVGHDFGGIVSWNLVDKYEDRVDKLIILNSPHPTVNKKFQAENEEQRKRSWYGYFFKLPILPEIVIKAGDYAFLSNSMAGSYTEEEISEYKRAWSEKDSNQAMIHWYRNLFTQPESKAPKRVLDVPLLVIWGKEDPHIIWQQAKPSSEMSKNGSFTYIDDASHWVMRDAPDEVNRLILDFLD